jgi:hypothetical protein
MAFAMGDDRDELFHLVRIAGFALGVPKLAQDRRIVELVDAVPGGEVDIGGRGQRTLAVGSGGLVAERRHHRLQREQTVEVGAADVDAGGR